MLMNAHGLKLATLQAQQQGISPTGTGPSGEQQAANIASYSVTCIAALLMHTTAMSCRSSAWNIRSYCVQIRVAGMSASHPPVL